MQLIWRSLTVAAALLWSASAWAVNCPPLPYTLVSGTTASAGQVNANFAAVLACLNNTAVAGPTPSVIGSVPLWNSVTGNLLKDATQAFPFSFGSIPTDIATINVGSYPVSAQIPSGVLEGLAVKVKVPASYTGTPWPNAAVAGYMLSSNSAAASTSLALFGYSGQQASGVNPYGANTVVSNCATVSCADNTGFDGNWLGIESNINVVHKAGSVQPTGIARAFYAAGGSTVVPASGAFVFDIASFGPNLPWSTLLRTAPGAVINAFDIGASNASASQNSQYVILHSRNGANADRVVTVYSDAGSNLQVSFDTASVAAGASISTNGHIASSTGHPTVSLCGAAPGQPTDAQASDVKGTITPGGGGPTSCTLTFAHAYAAAPSCVVSTSETAINASRGASTTTTVRFDFSAGITQSFDYICMQ